MFPAVEQEGKVYFRTWHDFAMMVSKVRFFEGKESLLGCKTPIYKISTTFFDQDKINALKDDIHGIDQLHAVSTSKNDLEITHVNAQKGTALLRYAQTKRSLLHKSLRLVIVGMIFLCYLLILESLLLWQMLLLL